MNRTDLLALATMVAHPRATVVVVTHPPKKETSTMTTRNPETYTEGLGEIIRAHRLFIGLSQRDMADRTGKDRRDYQRIENGRDACPPGLLGQIEELSDAFAYQVETVLDEADRRPVGDPLTLRSSLTARRARSGSAWSPGAPPSRPPRSIRSSSCWRQTNPPRSGNIARMDTIETTEVTHYLSRSEVAERLGIKNVRNLSGIDLPPHDVEVGRHKGWKPETIDAWHATRPGRGWWGGR